MFKNSSTLFLLATVLIGGIWPIHFSHAHGGVLMENDTCVMRIGTLSAHFSGYQPTISANDEFCEEIPEVAESVFVIDFLEDVLNTMPVEFRILRDDHNLGLAATWEDVQSLGDIDGTTIFHQPPALYPDGVLTGNFTFLEAGTYIGIVSARHEGKNMTFRAVFPFRVGAAGFLDYLPFLIGVLAFFEAFYWITSGGGFKQRLPQIKRALRLSEA